MADGHEADAPESKMLLTNLFLAANLACLAVVLAYFFTGPWGLLDEAVPTADAAEVGEALAERIVPRSDEILAGASELGSETAPIIYDAVAAQVAEDLPKFEKAAVRQGGKLAEQIAAKIRDQLKDEFREMLARYRTVLQEEFPGRDVDRLFAEVETRFAELVDKYKTEEFAAAAERTAEAWSEVPRLDDPPKDERLRAELGSYLVDWAVLRLKDAQLEG